MGKDRRKINEGVWMWGVGRKGVEETHPIECPQTRPCAGRWPFMRCSEMLATKGLYCTEESQGKISFWGKRKDREQKERWEGEQHRNTPVPSAPPANRTKCSPWTSAPGVALAAFCGRLSPRWPALARSTEHRRWQSPASSRHLLACIPPRWKWSVRRVLVWV
jgi:hypothetical protein